MKNGGEWYGHHVFYYCNFECGNVIAYIHELQEQKRCGSSSRWPSRNEPQNSYRSYTYMYWTMIIGKRWSGKLPFFFYLNHYIIIFMCLQWFSRFCLFYLCLIVFYLILSYKKRTLVGSNALLFLLYSYFTAPHFVQVWFTSSCFVSASWWTVFVSAGWFTVLYSAGCNGQLCRNLLNFVDDCVIVLLVLFVFLL